MRQIREGYNIFVGIFERKRSLGSRRCVGGGNIEIKLKVREEEDLYWIHLAQNEDLLRPLLNTLMNIPVT